MTKTAELLQQKIEQYDLLNDECQLAVAKQRHPANHSPYNAMVCANKVRTLRNRLISTQEHIAYLRRVRRLEVSR